MRVLGGHKFRNLGNLLNGWTDWHKIQPRMGIGLGMDIAKKNLPHETPEGAFWWVLLSQNMNILGYASDIMFQLDACGQCPCHHKSHFWVSSAASVVQLQWWVMFPLDLPKDLKNS